VNRERRKQIAALIARLDDIRTDVEHLRDEEVESADHMPDAVRGGGKGEAMRRAADHLTDAAGSLAGAIHSLEDARS